MTTTPQIIMLLALLVLCIAIVVIYLVRLYNSLIFMRNNAEKAFANIDTILQQRFQEIPNQLGLIAGATEHEKDLLQRITELREKNNYQHDSSLNWQQRLHTLNMIFSGLDHAALRIEDYPRLSSSDLFVNLQMRIAELEGIIAESRQFYNQCATLFNDKLMLIPNRYLMAPFDMTALELLNKRQPSTH